MYWCETKLDSVKKRTYNETVCVLLKDRYFNAVKQ